MTKKFNIERVHDLSQWAKKNKQEILNGKVIGLNVKPGFRNPGDAMPTSVLSLKSFNQFNIPENSPLRNKGIDLYRLYRIKTGSIDFDQQPAPIKGIGASF